MKFCPECGTGTNNGESTITNFKKEETQSKIKNFISSKVFIASVCSLFI